MAREGGQANAFHVVHHPDFFTIYHVSGQLKAQNRCPQPSPKQLVWSVSSDPMDLQV